MYTRSGWINLSLTWKSAVYNLSAAPISEKAVLSWHQFVDPKAKTESYTHEGPVVFVAKAVER